MNFKALSKILLLIFCSFFLISAFSQNEPDSLFKNKSEIYFQFIITSKSELDTLTRIISIDNVKGNQVFAYANKKEFLKFIQLNYHYTILPNPSSLIKPKMFDVNEKGSYNFDSYPTYPAYESMMYQYAATYPSLCKLDTIGILASSRKLLAVNITNFSDAVTVKPQFFYTSTMHGDEPTGYVLMLHLMDDLLSNYGKDSMITYLVNHVNIWINPLANPDGTYAGGNSTVLNATRYNANNIDLNRNYPDPADGPHPDGKVWQPETVAFMNFATNHHFVMSINFHTGNEVFNYPWDTWPRLHPDSDWWVYVAEMFADTNQYYSNYNGYFKDLVCSNDAAACVQSPGITDGYGWYTISGGRQDYMNYFQHCREATVELSSAGTDDGKIPADSTLPNYWSYTYHSFLNHIQQCLYGVRGIVTDSVTGKPLKASVFVENHDQDSSNVYSALPKGSYFRPIYQGNYAFTFSAAGYKTKTIQNVNAQNDSTTILNVQLVPGGSGITALNENIEKNVQVFPNPFHDKVYIQVTPGIQFQSIEVFNTVGDEIFSLNNISQSSSIDFSGVPQGLYFIRFCSGSSLYTKKLVHY